MEVRANAPALIAVMFVALVGCSVGEVPVGGDVTTPDAAMQNNNNNNNNAAGEASFNSTVKPLVTSCVSCHQGNQAPNLTSFTALEAKYKMKPGNTNVLVTKGNHAGIQYLGAADKMTVQNWIDSL